MNDPNIQSKTIVKKWWADRRLKYNLGLAASGTLAFICYVIAGVNLIMPYDKGFEITLFTTAFQGMAYLFMMLIANLFYNLGYWLDKKYNKKYNEKFRHGLFNLGFWFSLGLPFIIPLFIVIDYFIEFKK